MELLLALDFITISGAKEVLKEVDNIDVIAHAYSTILEMAKEASKKGLKLLGITEHVSGIPGICSHVFFENSRLVPRKMYGVELMLGAEINIIDYNGKLSLEDRLIDKLDVRIAGLHKYCYTPGNVEQNITAIIGAIKNPKIDIINLPADNSFPLDYEAIIQAAKKYNTLLEFNNNSLNPMNGRKNVRENNIHILQLCKKYGVPIILGSDAHVDINIIRCDFVCEVLCKINFPKELIINNSVMDFKNKMSLNRV